MAEPKIKSYEIAWAAGFFDGEGTTYLHESSGGYIKRYFYPRLVLRNTDFELLCRLQIALNNIGKIVGPYNGKNRKPIWEYMVNAVEDVETALLIIWPFIGNAKRQQAINTFKKYLELRQLQFTNTEHPKLVNKFCEKGHRKVQGKSKAWCLECVRIHRGYQPQRILPISTFLEKVVN